MRPLIVACLVAVARARPEAGYAYPSPSGTYIQNRGSSDFTSGSSGFTSGSSGFTSGSSGFTSGSSGFTSGENHASNFDYSTSQVPLIHKHVYVHVAPPEPEVQPRQVIPQSAAPQKHYKIVFIKAPSFPTPSTPVLSAQAQNQEKTLIYVLVKRPEDAAQISIPTVAPTQPSKPEVYFIKYKTQKETSPPSFVGGGTQSGNGRSHASKSNFGGEGSTNGSFYSPSALGKTGRPDSNAGASVALNYDLTPSQVSYLPPHFIKSTFGVGGSNITLNDTLPSQPSSGTVFGGTGRPDISK